MCLINRFYSYVDKYKKQGQLCKLLQEKLEHIERVASNAKYIAIHEKWNFIDVATAELCGYYHDIGRFSQYTNYKTFNDSKSVNHGKEGYRVIVENDLFHKVEEPQKQIILDAVRFHNALELPRELNERSGAFTKLVRDADKIDIFFMLTECIRTKSLDKHQDLLWDLPIGEANPVIVEKLLNNQQALYSDIRSGADVCLLQLTWIYGMTYTSSLGKLEENQTLPLLKQILPNNETIEACLKHIQNYIDTLF